MGDDGLSNEVTDRLSERRQQSQGASGTLILSDEEAYVHDTLTIRGLNLPENEELDVFWRTVKGKWGVLQGNEVNGAQYRPRTIHALTAQTDDQGKFSEEWTIPKDYGGEHKIEVRNGDDETIAKAAVRIRPYFEVQETEVPLGGFFTVKGYGIGPNVVESNYQLTWDNGMVGFITGVKNHGTATARIRAAGPVGSHQIQVWRNYRGVPFMQNNTQSPFGEVAAGRQYQFDVEVTEPDSELGGYWVEELFEESPLQVHVPDPEVEHDATIDITPQSGQPGTDAVITGTDFPANTEVELVWHSHSGHRVKDIPIRPEPLPEVLPTVTTDGDGRFQEEITIPQDKGSTRPIAAKIDGESVATTGFMMQADILEVSPQTAEQGETVEIELSGIGWPTYENAYYFVYDNKPIGYVCGLEARTAKTEITASGEPGYHFIDVYPSFFDVKDDEPNFELTPHLSYLDNHPIRPLPGLHMTIEITE
ncbi:MAG: hypothetical protein ACQEQJ_08860 [Halobacteriota archaeon]